LVTPISPQEQGNGLAHRCRFWRRVLAEVGSVRTVLVPVSSQPHPGDEAIALPTVASDDPDIPSRARWAPEHLGRAWRAADDEPVDLVLALRGDVAGFALGAAAATDAFVAVDLDDDDAALAASLGQDVEAARCRSWQATLASRADLLFSVTGFGTTTAVPNSVTIDHAVDRGPAASPPTILMVGNLTYEPNIRGVEWFLADVLPRVSAAVPNARLVVAGHESERFAPHGIGFVEDLDGLQREATVAVVPLLHGSGSRIKALDAFAARLPVVGTTVGLSGLPVEPDVHCLVADDPAGFADAVVRVLTDEGLAAGLAERARSLVERFDLDTVAAAAADALRAAADHRTAGVLAHAPRLVITEEPDGLVVVDEASMTAHHLNELAAAVFLLAEEPATRDAIADSFAEVVQRPVGDIREAVAAGISALVAGGLLLAHHGGQAG
jgi:glycosyltransferase involved in cell wall biosynthesis